MGFYTNSRDLPSPNGQPYRGGQDFYVARLSADGSRLLYGTYLGGSRNEFLNTHNLALDRQGNAYVSIWTNSPDFPTTSKAFQRTYGGGRADIAVVRLSPEGKILASTYLGGSDADSADGIEVDASGNILLSGETGSRNFPVTAGALQVEHAGGNDAVIVRLSSDLSRLLFATFLGGASYDNARCACIGADGSFCFSGSSDGPGWPLRNPLQATFAGGPGPFGAGDCIIGGLIPDGDDRR